MNELYTQIALAVNAVAFAVVTWQLHRANTIANNARNTACAANTQTANTACQLQALREGLAAAVARLPKTRSRKPKSPAAAPPGPPAPPRPAG